MNTKSPAPKRGVDRKGFLFCPDCGRSAPAEEGWPIRRRDGRTEVTCPNCENVLVSQPYSDSDSDCRSPLTA